MAQKWRGVLARVLPRRSQPSRSISTQDRINGLAFHVTCHAPAADIMSAVIREVDPNLSASPMHGSLYVVAQSADSLTFRHGTASSTSFRAELRLQPTQDANEVHFAVTKWTVAEAGLLSFPEMSRLRNSILAALRSIDTSFAQQ